MLCSSCPPCRPRAPWRCIKGVPLPTAPSQCGSALQLFHVPLPQGSVAVIYRISSAACPQSMRRCVGGVPYLLPKGNVAVHCTSCGAYCPQAAWQCIAQVPLPTALKAVWQCVTGGPYALPLGSVAVYCSISASRCQKKGSLCIIRVPRLIAPDTMAVHYHGSLRTAPGSVAVHAACRP